MTEERGKTTPEGDNPPVALPGEVTGGEGEGEAVAADAPAEAEEEVEAEGKDSTAAAAAVDGEPLGEGEIGGHAEEDTEPKSGGDGEGPAGTEAGAEGGSGDLGVPADAAAAAAGGDGGQKRQSVVAAMEKVKDGILGLDFSQMSTESKRNNKKGTKEKPGESSMEPQTKTANESAEAEEDEEEAFGEPFALNLDELIGEEAAAACRGLLSASAPQPQQIQTDADGEANVAAADGEESPPSQGQKEKGAAGEGGDTQQQGTEKEAGDHPEVQQQAAGTSEEKERRKMNSNPDRLLMTFVDEGKVATASAYLKEKKVPQLLKHLLTEAVLAKPENLKAFLAAELQKLHKKKTEAENVNPIFSGPFNNSHLSTMFDMLDGRKRGFISNAQMLLALQQLKAIPANSFPLDMGEDGQVDKSTFVTVVKAEMTRAASCF